MLLIIQALLSRPPQTALSETLFLFQENNFIIACIQIILNTGFPLAAAFPFRGWLFPYLSLFAQDKWLRIPRSRATISIS